MSNEDEDAEFAAEIRAAYESEQRGGVGARSRGPEALLGPVVHEGFGSGGGSYRGDNLGNPPETGGLLWPGQEVLRLRRRGAELGEIEGDEGADEGVFARAEGLNSSAENRRVLGLTTGELQARTAALCATADRGLDAPQGSAYNGRDVDGLQTEEAMTTKRRRE